MNNLDKIKVVTYIIFYLIMAYMSNLDANLGGLSHYLSYNNKDG